MVFLKIFIRIFSPKKNRYLWLVTVVNCEIYAKRKPSASLPMEGDDYPDNYGDVCDT
jgi:hypothetical protein